MTKRKDKAPEKTVGAVISEELDARVERVRTALSLKDGDPEYGPPKAQILRLALEEWVERQEKRFGIEKKR